MLGVLVTLIKDPKEIGRREKAAWTFIFFALLLLEIKSVYQDRREHDNEQSRARAEQLERFGKIADSIDKNLAQTMGGSGYPIFLPTFPMNKPAPDDLWPVKVIYLPEAGTDTDPLIDVNVDIEVRPAKGSGTAGFTKEVLGSLFDPAHYNLGNVVSGIFAAPFRLQSGKRYQLVITTRRGFFYENVNIDQSAGSPGGYHVSWCLYRHADNKLLDGKCD